MTVLVDVFQYWVYAQSLPAHGDFDEWTRILDRTSDGAYMSPNMLEPILRAYVLGDRLLAHRFRRVLNNAIVKYDALWSVDREDAETAVTYAFDNIAPERPILQFIVGSYSEHCQIPDS